MTQIFPRRSMLSRSGTAATIQDSRFLTARTADCARPFATSSNVTRSQEKPTGGTAMRSAARRWKAATAFALVESCVGMALLVITLGGVFSMNAHLMGLVKQGKESTLATEMIQERFENFRTGGWTQCADPSYLQAGVGVRTTTANNLQGVTETVRVESMTDPSVNITYTRAASGAVTPGVVSTTTLVNEPALKMTVDVQWTSRGRLRKRSMVTIFSRDGLLSL